MPDTLLKKYYKISEVAEILAIPASTLRFWEKQFTIISPKRNSHGTRFYTPADVETIRMVYYLVKEKGFKLDAAQQQIRINREGIDRRAQALSRLKKIRTTLSIMLQAIDEKRKRAN